MQPGKPVQRRRRFNGTRLKKLRVGRNLSARALAEIIGASDQAVYAWECERSRPSPEIIARIASALGVKPGVFQP